MKKHWNFKYIINRILNLAYFKLNKGVPWLSKKANNFFEFTLTKEMIGVEFGSGRSTHWIAKRCKTLTSIEHDNKWYEIVNSQGTPFNLNYFCLKETEYSSFTKKLESNSIDFCLIDGLDRDLIANNIISKIKPGGFILIDDIERYLPSQKTFSPSKNCCRTPLWDKFDKKTKNWERKYFSDGITDQLFIFKPN